MGKTLDECGEGYTINNTLIQKTCSFKIVFTKYPR